MTRTQIIYDGKRPAFAVIPYAQWVDLTRHAEAAMTDEELFAAARAEDNGEHMPHDVVQAPCGRRATSESVSRIPRHDAGGPGCHCWRFHRICQPDRTRYPPTVQKGAHRFRSRPGPGHRRFELTPSSLESSPARLLPVPCRWVYPRTCGGTGLHAVG